MIKISLFVFMLPVMNGYIFKGPSPVKFRSTAKYALQNDATEQFRKTTISVISVVAGFTGIMTPNFYQLSIPAALAVEKTVAPSELKSALNEYKQTLTKTETKIPDQEVLPAKTKPVAPATVVPTKAKTVSPKTDAKTPPPPTPTPPSPPKEIEYKIKTDVDLLNQLSQTRNNKASTPKTTNSPPAKIVSIPKVTVAPPATTPPPKAVVANKVVPKAAITKPALETKKTEPKKSIPEEIALKSATDKLVTDKTMQTKLTTDLRVSKSTATTLKSTIASIEKDISVEKKVLQKKDLDKKEGEKSVDSIIRLQKNLSKAQKDLANEETKTKKLTSDLESIKKQLLSDESSIKSKDMALKTRQAEIAKAAKETAERKAAEAAALKAKQKAELIKKSEGEVTAAASQVEKIKQDVSSLSSKYQSELKVLSVAESSEKKAVDLIKQKQSELEKAKADAASEATKLKSEADKVAQLKKQIESTNQQLNAKIAVKSAAEKTLAANRAMK